MHTFLINKLNEDHATNPHAPYDALAYLIGHQNAHLLCASDRLGIDARPPQSASPTPPSFSNEMGASASIDSDMDTDVDL